MYAYTEASNNLKSLHVPTWWLVAGRWLWWLWAPSLRSSAIDRDILSKDSTKYLDKCGEIRATVFPVSQVWKINDTTSVHISWGIYGHFWGRGHIHKRIGLGKSFLKPYYQWDVVNISCIQIKKHMYMYVVFSLEYVDIVDWTKWHSKSW